MQRQAELEQQLATMKSEMSLLKAVVTMQQPPYSAPQAPTISQNYVSGNHEQPDFQPPFLAQAAHIEEVPAEAATPSYDHDPYTYDWHSASPSEQSPTMAHPPPVPAFEEGCSSRPRPAATFSNRSLSQSPNAMPSPGDRWMPSPSPSVISPGGGTDASSSIMSPSLSSLGKRRTPPRSPTQSVTDLSADESDVPTHGRPRKRRNGHDSRCLTIQVLSDILTNVSRPILINLIRPPSVNIYFIAWKPNRTSHSPKAILKVPSLTTTNPCASTGTKPHASPATIP